MTDETPCEHHFVLARELRVPVWGRGRSSVTLFNWGWLAYSLRLLLSVVLPEHWLVIFWRSLVRCLTRGRLNLCTKRKVLLRGGLCRCHTSTCFNVTMSLLLADILFSWWSTWWNRHLFVWWDNLSNVSRTHTLMKVGNLSGLSYSLAFLQSRWPSGIAWNVGSLCTCSCCSIRVLLSCRLWLLGLLIGLNLFIPCLLVVGRAAVLALQSIWVSFTLGPCAISSWLIEATVQVLTELGCLTLGFMERTVLISLPQVGWT